MSKCAYLSYITEESSEAHPHCTASLKSAMKMEEKLYTEDGTTTLDSKPANKNNTGKWKACPFILGTECCERLAYYGMSSNLVNYLKQHLNQGNVAASRNINNWSGTCYITPLLGAFLADAYWGRYWTIAIFSIVYITGMTLLTVSASVPGVKPLCNADGVCDATTGQAVACFSALYMIALGTGGIKPCVSSFGADQFDENDENERKKKSSFFNWFYLAINVGALIAGSVMVYIQLHVGWGWGFGVPAVAMALAVVSFFSGSRLYRLQRPGGSPLTRIFQVIVASVRKYNVKVPSHGTSLYETSDEESAILGSRKLEHTNQFRFLDKAAVQTETDDGHLTSPWRICSVTQVEELKSVIRVLPIWASGIVYNTVSSQMSTMFIIQGNTMDQRMGPHFKIPSASLSIFDTISVIFWIPVYDFLIVPCARKLTGHERGFTHLQRIGIGLFISILAMVTAAILEIVRLDMVRRHDYYDFTTVPISIFWQFPQYFIIGCSEVFASIGHIEFFYDQAPDAMRSLCSALPLTTVALANYLSSALVGIVATLTTKHGAPGWIPDDNINLGHLDYFYWLLTGLSVMNFVMYLWIAKAYTYKKAVGKPGSIKCDGEGQ